MLQHLADIWPHLVDALFMLGLLAAGLLIGLATTNNRTTPMTPEDIQLHRRQKQGGSIFSDILRDMRDRENARLDSFVRRLAAPETLTEDRALYAEQVAASRRQLDAIDRMLLMKEPES